MRSFSDRLRHTLIFEAIALFLVAVPGGWLLDRPMEIMGALSLMFSVLAMSWNLFYNWMFDLWDRKHRGMARRGVGIRIVHAVLFEAGLVIAGLFLIAWWLDMTYWDAFLLDVSLSAFFLVYAFCYNWAYDMVFPVPRAA
ncbi:MAG: PACE efflux transporter [Rhodospirillaceae bacterium]|nr:PACE efflux transporter [Rhodospirillaceae bacterium]